MMRRLVSRCVPCLVALAACVQLACADFDHLSVPAADGGADARIDAPTDAAASDAGACAGDHVYFDPASGHCYAFLPNHLQWSAAESDCVATFRGHLASITSGAEQTFVSNLVDTELASEGDAGPDGVWIGLHKADAGAPYVWSDGDALTFTNWGQGATKTNPCVFQYGARFGHHWDDYMCSVSAEYVCERPF